jgi:hypothetical protein
MRPICPACSAQSISRLALLRSTIGLGKNPKCTACGIRLSVDKFSQTFFVGIFLIALLLSAMLSIKARSYLPYLLLPIALTAASFTILSFGKPSTVHVKQRWSSAIHFGLLSVFILMLAVTQWQ